MMVLSYSLNRVNGNCASNAYAPVCTDYWLFFHKKIKKTQQWSSGRELVRVWAGRQPNNMTKTTNVLAHEVSISTNSKALVGTDLWTNFVKPIVHTKNFKRPQPQYSYPVWTWLTSSVLTVLVTFSFTIGLGKIKKPRKRAVGYYVWCMQPALKTAMRRYSLLFRHFNVPTQSKIKSNRQVIRWMITLHQAVADQQHCQSVSICNTCANRHNNLLFFSHFTFFEKSWAFQDTSSYYSSATRVMKPNSSLTWCFLSLWPCNSPFDYTEITHNLLNVSNSPFSQSVPWSPLRQTHVLRLCSWSNKHAPPSSHGLYVRQSLLWWAGRQK